MQQHYKDRKSSWKSGSGYAGFFRSYKRIRGQELSLSISNQNVLQFNPSLPVYNINGEYAGPVGGYPDRENPVAEFS